MELALTCTMVDQSVGRCLSEKIQATPVVSSRVELVERVGRRSGLPQRQFIYINCPDLAVWPLCQIVLFT